MQPSDPIKAALWMLGAALSFTAMAVAGREIQTEMNTFELMLYRSLIGGVAVTAIVAATKAGFAQLRTTRPELHAMRNVVHYTGQNLWFYAVAAIPLAQVAALEFTNPIWVALFAPLMLGEALTRPRALAALIGFFGVLIVARPGVAPLQAGHAAALLAAVGFAMTTILTKRLMHGDGVLCVLFWMTVSQAAMSLVLSLPGGIPAPSPEMLPWLIVVGLAGLTAHYSLTSALGHAPASIVAPMEFLRLPIIAAAGMAVYGEPLQPAVFLGAGVIIAANLVNLRGERARRRP